MRKNKTSVHGRAVVLVPYRQEHVQKYHGWMQNEELLQLTASEPLTLEEEYAMQQSWMNDEDKCTFIVLSQSIYMEKNCDEIAAMIGDVNLFLNDEENRHTAEIEIMIAEKDARGQGMGKEALFVMMRYGVEYLDLTTVTAKIGVDNLRSLNLFRKIGFQEMSRSEIFKEVTLEWKVTEESKNWLWTETDHINIAIESDRSENSTCIR